MWYAHRNLQDYRTNKSSSYAESDNGIDWMMKLVLMLVKVDGIEYPFVYDHNGKRYNGNTFGKSGFGYAVLEE